MNIDDLIDTLYRWPYRLLCKQSNKTRRHKKNSIRLLCPSLLDPEMFNINITYLNCSAILKTLLNIKFPFGENRRKEESRLEVRLARLGSRIKSDGVDRPKVWNVLEESLKHLWEMHCATWWQERKGTSGFGQQHRWEVNFQRH